MAFLTILSTCTFHLSSNERWTARISKTVTSGTNKSRCLALCNLSLSSLQSHRDAVLNRFRSGKITVLFTTDVAARGLDIPEVDLVLQCSPPRDIEAYVHRSGRTGRAGKSGISICLFTPFGRRALKKIEDLVVSRGEGLGPVQSIC